MYLTLRAVRAWLADKRPGGGQSFLAKRLEMKLTSRLRTPPRQAVSSVLAKASVFFFHPGSLGASLGCRFPNTATQSQNRKTEDLETRDRRVDVGLLLAT